MGRAGSVVSIGATAFVAIQIARAAQIQVEPAQVEEVTVTGEATGSVTSASLETSAGQKRQIPGAFNVKGTDDMNRGRASNVEDLLRLTPGVFLQSDSDAEVSKISIRGSGITSEDEPIGVMFFLDGLSYNQGDGEAILEDLDVGTLKSAEVFRGAASFRYGALTLGGAINLVPLTGYDAGPFQARVQGGSYDYLRSQVSGGAVKGACDEFASLSYRSRDGFRNHSSEDTEIFFANAGYKLTEQIENRLYLTLGRTDRELPGALTKSEMEKAPSQANSVAISEDWNKDWSYIRVADKLSLRTEVIQFDVGAFWFHRDLENRGFFSTDFRQGIEMFYSDNFGGMLNFVSQAELFGRKNTFSIGFAPQFEFENSQNFENLSGNAGATSARGEGVSVNIPCYFQDQFYIVQPLSIVAGVQAIFAERDFTDSFLNDAQGDQSHRQDFWGFNPKLGAIYEINRDTQIFLNCSRSWQPPSFDNLVEFTEGSDSSVVYTPLRAQHGWTIEVGTRGQYSAVQWDLSLYRSWLRNELLEQNDRFGNDIGATNVERSIHQGVEVSLEIDLLHDIFVPKQIDGTGDRLSVEQSYTLNDFKFDDDSVYRNNRIAGIPIHIYEAQFLYKMPSGFYAGPNVQCNLSRYPVDHANTLFADRYALIGFRAGFQQKNGFSIYIDCRNLTDERYASAVDAIADARTKFNPEIFHPGDGRAIYGGVSWTW